ncbi:hypothetical protein FEMY_19010 [Ferrovum myxofaciens]|uniref:Uncharacterized protein n=2 Tax=Ferrovum myxofaciens TaxID=416213 RepID=A0A149VWH6_9PROT|nr:hypothetical protein FEMY_19010 [Ferrovum myxofaciens]
MSASGFLTLTFNTFARMLTIRFRAVILQNWLSPYDPLQTVTFAIPQAAIASLLPDELSLVQRRVTELSGRLARQLTDWSSA